MTQKPPEMQEILPCPFCGNPPQTKEWKHGSHDAIRIWCDECSVETRSQGVRDNAITSWNTRYILPAPKEDVERALEALQRVQDWKEGKGGLLPHDFIFGIDKRYVPETKGHLETIRRVLLANVGRG